MQLCNFALTNVLQYYCGQATATVEVALELVFSLQFLLLSVAVCLCEEIKKLVRWGTDGRLPLSGDFRSLIVE